MNVNQTRTALVRFWMIWQHFDTFTAKVASGATPGMGKKQHDAVKIEAEMWTEEIWKRLTVFFMKFVLHYHQLARTSDSAKFVL